MENPNQTPTETPATTPPTETPQTQPPQAPQPESPPAETPPTQPPQTSPPESSPPNPPSYPQPETHSHKPKKSKTAMAVAGLLIAAILYRGSAASTLDTQPSPAPIHKQPLSQPPPAIQAHHPKHHLHLQLAKPQT